MLSLTHDNIKFGRREAPMFEFLNTILLRFRPCFSRKAAFDWFVILIVGFLVRSDTLGVTSVIRDLALAPSVYPCLIHFFHAKSWDWYSLSCTWAETVANLAPLKRISGRVVLIGDGVKRASDGKFMPCIKKMVQESESANKPQDLFGHFFGTVGVLIGSATKSFCLPLSSYLHDGDHRICHWMEEEPHSHVVRMFLDGVKTTKYFGKSLFVLDRYFLTVPLLTAWKTDQQIQPDHFHIVTRAKKNCVVYERPEPYKGRGRKPLHGKAISLKELFQVEATSFQTKTLPLYGCEKEVRFLSKIYLWGKKLYQPLQFVLAEYDGSQIILASTDLTMTPEDILTAYAYRFKIEAMFREMKQQVGAFFYHFWTKATPKLNRYRKKGIPDPLGEVKDHKQRNAIIDTVLATENYVLLCCIATGILQLLCLKYEGKINVSKFRDLRTPSKFVLSEASMMTYLRKNFFRFMGKKGEITITKIISRKQISLENEEADLFIR